MMGISHWLMNKLTNNQTDQTNNSGFFLTLMTYAEQNPARRLRCCSRRGWGKKKKKIKKTSSTNRTRKTPGELFLNWGTQSFYRVPNSGVNHCSSPPPSTLRGSFTLKLVFELHSAFHESQGADTIHTLTILLLLRRWLILRMVWYVWIMP